MFSGFMVNAWVAGTIVATVAGVVGFFVVLRGSAFAAHAIPNGAFAGAAGAYWLGLNTLVGLGVFAVLAAIGIGSLGARRRDVATALALVMMLALGSLFLSLSGGYEPEVYSLLFGEILGVSTTELLPVALVSVGCILVVVMLYRPLLLSSAAPDLAEARGVRPRAHGDRLPARRCRRDHGDAPRRRGAPHLQPHDRPSGCGARLRRAPGARHRALRRPRAAHGVGGHRLLVPVELARRVLRGRLQRGVLRHQPRLGRPGPAP